MHTYPNNSASGTLLDNSSEGSSPQSSASNEEEVQELLHRASGSGLAGETKPIYNFSIPEMIRRRNSQDPPGSGSPGVRILSSSHIEPMPQRRRHHRLAFPTEEEDLSSICQQRKYRRVSNRSNTNNTAFIDLTHSPDLPQGTSSNDERYNSLNPTQSESSHRQGPGTSGARRRSPMNQTSRDHIRNVNIHGNVYPVPLDHIAGRPQRFTSLQHRNEIPTGTPTTRCLRHAHYANVSIHVDQQQPPVINLDDSPLNRYDFNGRSNPRMTSNARHRRDVVNDLRAQIRTQLEEDEVQFVGEWHPRQQPTEGHVDNPAGESHENARRTQRVVDEARHFFQSVLHRRLPARRRFADDYLLNVRSFDIPGVPPLHHIAGGVDNPVMDGDYEALWRLAERLGQAKPKGLSKQDIEKIPSFRFSSSCMADTNMTCVVCMSEYSTCEKLRRLSCNHDFHSKCIDKWLKSNKTCPVCRDEVKT